MLIFFLISVVFVTIGAIILGTTKKVMVQEVAKLIIGFGIVICGLGLVFPCCVISFK